MLKSPDDRDREIGESFLDKAAEKKTINDLGIENTDTEEEFSLKQFSLVGQSAQMRKNMLDEIHIMKNLALLGQITAIYARPNTGKTLCVMRFLIDSVNNGVIDGEDLFYLNCDDTHRGLIEKLELAEKCGFHMIAPSHNGFEVRDFIKYINTLIRDDQCKGKIIVLDTLKKFTNLMDKNKSTSFMNVARSWASHGGSMILLAHTNKNRDANGKAVAGGTSDIIDDADCAYILDEVSHIESEKSILFENVKLRGDVLVEAAFSYSTARGQTYEERILSIESLDEEHTRAAKEKVEHDKDVENDQDVIDAITAVLITGKLPKTLLVDQVKEQGISKNKINTILAKYEGRNFFTNKWCVEHGEKNTKIYLLLNSSSYH